MVLMRLESDVKWYDGIDEVFRGTVELLISREQAVRESHGIKGFTGVAGNRQSQLSNPISKGRTTLLRVFGLDISKPVFAGSFLTPTFVRLHSRRLERRSFAQRLLGTAMTAFLGWKASRRPLHQALPLLA